MQHLTVPRPTLAHGSRLYGRASDNTGRNHYYDQATTEYKQSIAANNDIRSSRTPITVDHLTQKTHLSKYSLANNGTVNFAINSAPSMQTRIATLEKQLKKAKKWGGNVPKEHYIAESLSYGKAIHHYEGSNALSHTIGKDITTETDFNERMTRTSKFGIVHATERGNRVQFALDDLDQVGAATKADYYKNGMPQKSITGSELRFIYRNRGQLRTGVDFIQGGNVVPAPWESHTLPAPSPADSPPIFQAKVRALQDNQARVDAWTNYGTQVSNKVRPLGNTSTSTAQVMAGSVRQHL